MTELDKTKYIVELGKALDALMNENVELQRKLKEMSEALDAWREAAQARDVFMEAQFSKHVALGHELFGAGGKFPNALTIGQDVVLDGMRWLAENHTPKLPKLPHYQWAVTLSDGFCAFQYVFGTESRQNTCVDEVVALLAAFLQGDAKLVGKEIL